MQIYLFKPVQMTVSTVFLLIIIYTFGNMWAKFLPKQSWVENTRFERLGPVLHFFNPGPFGLKEVRRPRCYLEGSSADILAAYSMLSPLLWRLLRLAGALPCRILLYNGLVHLNCQRFQSLILMLP